MALNKTYIPDASVIIKWYSKEINSELAVKLKSHFISKKISLLTPTFLTWELSNFFGRVYSAEDAAGAINNFINHKIPMQQIGTSIAYRAFLLMKELAKVSFYDASYHALAIEKNATFLTCDKKYYQKAKNYGHIQLLKDYT